MRFILLLIGTIFLFTGCVKKIYIPVVETKYERTPDILLVDDINVTKPPNKKEFVDATPIGRSVLLSNTVVDLYSSIYLYKLKLKDIREYNEKLDKLAEESKKD